MSNNWFFCMFFALEALERQKRLQYRNWGSKGQTILTYVRDASIAHVNFIICDVSNTLQSRVNGGMLMYTKLHDLNSHHVKNWMQCVKRARHTGKLLLSLSTSHRPLTGAKFCLSISLKLGQVTVYNCVLPSISTPATWVLLSFTPNTSMNLQWKNSHH